MPALGSEGALRKTLIVDALTCTACGALMTLAAGPLATLTQIPASLLLYAGLSLFPIAAFMVLVATRATHSVLAVEAVIVGNVLWTAASVWLMVGDAIAPSLLGQLFLGVQAATVALLTALEVRHARSASQRRAPLLEAR